MNNLNSHCMIMSPKVSLVLSKISGLLRKKDLVDYQLQVIYLFSIAFNNPFTDKLSDKLFSLLNFHLENSIYFLRVQIFRQCTIFTRKITTIVHG